MPTRDTKSVILDTAVRLFNQHGSQRVSTNRIAAEISISVGNLYYHFNNKEEIIRALYDRMVAELDELWSDVRAPSLKRLRKLFNDQIEQMGEYQFFQREQLALLIKDPLLSKKNRQVRRRRREEVEAFMRGLMDAGVLSQPDDPDGIPALVKAIWIVSENWLAFLELEGMTVNRKSIHAGTELVMRVLTPYLSPGTSAG